MMARKLCAMVLCLIMAVSVMAFTGCGEDNGARNDMADDGIVTLNLFIQHTWYPVDAFEGIIPDLIREATGVHLDVTIATDRAQLGLMIASGNLPDLIWTDEEQDRLSDRRLTMSFTELEQDFGASFAEVSAEAVAIGRSLSQSGDFYTILNHFNNSEEWASLQMGAGGQPAIFYRKDLLDTIGIDGNSIDSVDRLIEVLVEVRDAYPDMVPFGLGGFWKFQGLANAFGVEGARFNPDTGEYFYVATTPIFREFLEAANMMHRLGLITAEQYANENEAHSDQAAFNNQNVFHNGFLSYTDFAHLQVQTQNIHPDAEWAILPFLGPGNVGFGRGWSGLFVSRNVSDPYAAARLLTFLHSVDGRRASIWGREGIDFTVDAAGVPTFSEEFIEARTAGQLLDIWNWRFNFGTTAIEEIYMTVSGIDEGILALISTHGVNSQSFPEVGIAQPTAASSEGVLRERLEELRRVHEARIIFTDSDEEFEAAFDEFMHALEQTGVQRYSDYMTNRIREVREQLGW